MLLRQKVFALGRIVSVACVLALFALGSPADAASVKAAPNPPAWVYVYDGAIYDRVFSVLYPPRSLRRVSRPVLDRRASSLAGTPYTIANLEAQLLKRSGFQTSGFPTAVNSAGVIAYTGSCYCDATGTTGTLGYLINNGGTILAELLPSGPPSDVPNAYVYAVDGFGYSAGSSTSVLGNDYLTGYTTWTPEGGFLYADDNQEPPPGSFALAINSSHDSVGQSPYQGQPFATLFEPAPFVGSTSTKLLPPKNTAWIGTATGINNSGTIVGYALFPHQSVGRAVRFFPNANAVVIPVAPAGVSSSAQAINAAGDVVGNAGSQAFLYKNNRVTYLPRPPGEEAGNAVAYGINASDEIVGDIITSTSQTAFLYVDGRSYDLTSLLSAKSGWQITHAAGISNRGQIVGTGNLGSYSMMPSPKSVSTTRLLGAGL